MKFINIIFLTVLFFHSFSFANDIKDIKIIGNENIDDEVIFSIIEEKINDYSDENINLIIKTLYDTGNFKNIEIQREDNFLILKIEENPSINNVSFIGNDRFKDSEILEIFKKDKYFKTFNEYNVNTFIDEFRELYMSYGYNLIKIDYNVSISENNNKFVDLNFNINEGNISKVNRIFFSGNNNYSSSQLKSLIKSKQKNILRILGNTNFKKFQVENDKIRIKEFYINSGYKDVVVNYQTEFISSNNRFNIYFNISEGKKYNFQNINLLLDSFTIAQEYKDNLKELLQSQVDKKLKRSKTYNETLLENLRNTLTEYLYEIGIVFFEIQTLEKNIDNNIDILLKFNDIEPKYVKLINIIGNTRTKDKVIRREVPFSEGDAINNKLLRNANRNIKNLGYFKSVQIKEYPENENVDIEIEVEETSTGQFNVGLAFDSFDGATFIAGLDEKNIFGDGRNLNLTINSSSRNTQYKFGIIEPYLFNQPIDFIYNISYEDKDLSDSQSYELSTFNTNVGFRYLFSEDLKHSIILEYILKDYEITDSSTASDSIKKLSGANADILLNNTLVYNKLDSFIRPSNGAYTSFVNIISPSTNDDNGYIKNILTYRKYYNYKSNIISIQNKFGNIFSLQNKEIPTDDKFSLGGRWLRGFDLFGAGPRNSRKSYVGGKSLFVSKLDFQRPLFKNSDNPVDLDLFVDVGTVFDNKVEPTNSEESFRSSYGIGIKFYSPIGPVGFTWAFPITSEEYDIKRMFNFSIGNLN